MSKARERRKKRQQRQQMAQQQSRSPRSTRSLRQIVPADRIQLPEIKLPGGQWLLLIPAGLVVLIVVVIVLGLLNPPEERAAPNAIWLDARWSHSSHDPQEINELARTLRDHNIGKVFLYVSSLRSDNTWGSTAGTFTQVEPLVNDFTQRFRAAYPDAELIAWIEVSAVTEEGYRLDALNTQSAAANFSALMLSDYGFDGVLMDVKPIFEETDDFLALLRAVRSSIGLDTPLLVAVPPDLTPSEGNLLLPEIIAPGTEWSQEYKQRVALQADQVVITAYNSYQSNPVGYIEWVSYQVQSYVDALTAMDTGATILVSVPYYAERLPAHDASIETLAAGLDGVNRVTDGLDEDQSLLVAGVALFTDEDLSNDDWQVFREKWLR